MVETEETKTNSQIERQTRIESPIVLDVWLPNDVAVVITTLCTVLRVALNWVPVAPGRSKGTGQKKDMNLRPMALKALRIFLL